MLIAFLFLGFLNSYSLNLQNRSTKIAEIKKIKEFRNKYIFYTSSPIYGNNYVENIEDWIEHFEKEVAIHKNNENIFYLNFILVHLYRIASKIEKSLDLGIKTYYNYADKTTDNSMLCRLLQELETCYYLQNNNLELIRINKEKFKVCGKNAVILYNIYFNMGLYDLALKNYKEVISFNTNQYKKYNLYAQAFHNNDFGVYYMYDNKLDSALYHFKKSILLFKKEKDSSYRKKDIAFMLGVVDGNIATCYLKQKKYKEAIPLYLHELKASDVYYKGMNWLGSEKVYERIALCYINKNQFKNANFYINKLKNFKNKFYKIKSEYFSKLKNTDSTLFYTKKYIQISDSIFNTEMKQQKIESLGILEVNNTLKTQEEQISILVQKDDSKSIQIRFILIISIIIIFFFILLLYYYLEKNKKQILIIQQKDEIELALTNNKTLLKELNHRVKNNLQMVSSVISLQASKITDISSKKHFNAAINRIKVLSKIHNSLYSNNQLNEINLLNYVLVLKDYLINSIINPEIKVDFKIDIPSSLFLNNDKKTTIGLIINELITNSLKYAFPNKEENHITIAIYKKDNYCYFTFSDNGKGFIYKDIDKSKSVGLNLILRLVNQLGEEAEINSNNGFNITFKFLC